LWGTVRLGEAIPSWIAVHQSKLPGIEDITDRWAPKKSLRDARKMIAHWLFAPRFGRHRARVCILRVFRRSAHRLYPSHAHFSPGPRKITIAQDGWFDTPSPENVRRTSKLDWIFGKLGT
jgi:hypothetical protein